MGLRVEWGPVAEVARSAGTPEAPAGYLWGLAVEREEGALWPPGLRVFSVVPAREPPSRGWLGRWVDNLWAFLTRPFRRPAPVAPAPAPRPLSECLVAAQRWLAERNLRAVSKWFAPLWYDSPTALAAVSETGLAWALECRALAEEGPRASPATLSAPKDRRPATPADCLAFHLSIEAIVERLPAELGIAPVELIRLPGGLRTRSFLTAWPSLCLEPNGPASIWRGRLERLMAQSPLTRLVYADLLPQQAAADWAALFSPARFQSGSEWVEVCPRGSGWLDIWMSLLARSLVGAVLSPSRMEEEVRAAERKLEEARRKAEARRWGRSRDTVDPAVSLAASEVTRVSGLARRAHADRMASLPSMLSANPVFQLRFTDMLVRRLAAGCGPQMAQAWRKRSPEDWEEPRNRFFFPEKGSQNPVCLEAFEAALYGPDKAPAPRAEQGESWRETFFSFLPRGVSSAENLASASGVPLERCRQLLAQYRRPVALPTPGYQGHSPQYILERWVQHFIDRLPAVAQVQATQVSVEAVEVE